MTSTLAMPLRKDKKTQTSRNKTTLMVVMTNQNNEEKIKKAAAIAYDPEKDVAPKVVATGKGELAEQIIRLAKAHGVEIKQDEDLAEILSAMDVESSIPIEAYGAIAEILSYIYKNSKSKRDGNG
jgi:flagellar biosynthesis protein